MGYLVICDKHVDGAVLWHQVAGTEGGAGEVSDGSWNASEPITGFATWSLTEPAHGWSAEEPLAPLQPGVTYSLYGGTKDNTSSAGSVDFTTADLASMAPGQVLIAEYDRTAQTWGTATETVEQFQSSCDG